MEKERQDHETLFLIVVDLPEQRFSRKGDLQFKYQSLSYVLG
jgi:hypothetical protein